MNPFSRLFRGLQRTRQGLRRGLGRLAGGSPGAGDFEVLEESLLAADVGPRLTEEILCALREEGGKGDLLERLRSEIHRRLEVAEPAKMVEPTGPEVILLVGVNGSGKTTTAGKLARRFSEGGRKVILAAADTFRAAAIEQAEAWAERAGCQVVRQATGSDPAAVVHDALEAARARGADVVLVDTAGRLHTRQPLMEELTKIHRVAGRAIEGAPHQVLLVLDASTGQNGLHQARGFLRAAGVTGVILTKLDGTARGGVVLPIIAELQVPIRYVGVGESVEDLLPFDARLFVSGLLEEDASSPAGAAL
ncbi:MAG: signal recognition particle-docking protein FtsY [Acidobacteria bacterium]|nr:signal recognition particle-docking protein FtsY [Acidobacteriota bacterium]